MLRADCLERDHLLAILRTIRITINGFGPCILL